MRGRDVRGADVATPERRRHHGVAVESPSSKLHATRDCTARGARALQDLPAVAVPSFSAAHRRAPGATPGALTHSSHDDCDAPLRSAERRASRLASRSWRSYYPRMDAAPPGEIKLYFDYKSPFAFLASGPAFDLDRRFRVRVRWIPYQLRIKGKGERSQNSEWKAKYSYLDARRFATPRGLVIKGPRKVYDTEPALIGALFAMHA